MGCVGAHLVLKDHDYCENKKGGGESLGCVGAYLTLIMIYCLISPVHDYCEIKEGVFVECWQVYTLQNKMQSGLKDHDYCQSKRTDFIQRGCGVYGLDSSLGMHHKRKGGDKPWLKNVGANWQVACRAKSKGLVKDESGES